MNTKLWCIHKIDILTHLKDWEQRLIDKISSTKDIKRGEILYLQGSSDKSVYFLERGTVKLNKLNPEGKVITIDILKSGTLFGELGAIEDVERDETAIVMEDGQICIMSKENFDSLLNSAPEFAVHLNKIITLRRWKIENRLLDLLYSTVEERLAKILLDLIEDFGKPDKNAIVLRLKLTHQDLSELIASTRETTTATINNLKKQGIIDYEEKHIRILDKQKLHDVSQQAAS
jgi:CRP/FNR family transcriptional regulator